MQRFINLGMIITLAAVMAVATDDNIYPAVFSVLGLAGVTGRFELKLRPIRRVILLLFITLIFGVKYRFDPDGKTSVNFPLIPQWLILSQYFLAMMTTYFFLPSSKNMPPSLPLLGLVGLLCLGQQLPNSKNNINLIYQLLSLFYLVLVISYSAAGRKIPHHYKSFNLSMRHTFSVIILAIVLTGGWISGHYLYVYRDEAQQLITKMGINPNTFNNFVPHTPASSEFSDSSTLSDLRNLKIRNAKQVAINVFSDQPPGYLRAKAMAKYANSEWSSVAENPVTLTPNTLPENLTMSDTGNIFNIKKAPSQKWQVMDIWPSPKVDGTLFTPQNTTVFRCPVKEVFLLDNDIITTEDLLIGLNYSAAVPQTLPPETLPQTARNKYLTLPKNLDPQLHQLAKNIFTHCTSAKEKMDRIEAYFHTHYEYHLGIDIPDGQDPLTYFLLASPHPAAHCEYFASGAAVLLRMANVPTRYINGYVVAEKNPYSNSWVARNQDAHAWVEAWDDQVNRWVRVEATSSAGVPTGKSISKADQFIDYLNFRLQELRVALSRNGIKGLAGWLWQRVANFTKLLLTTWLGLTALALFIIYTLQKVWRSYRQTTATNNATADKTLIAMHRLLNKMDHRLKKQNHIRLPTETLHHFATLIQKNANERSSEPLKATANWYRHYARILYSNQIKPEDITQLKDRMQNI